MKNQKPAFIAMVFALAFALALVSKGAPSPNNAPSRPPPPNDGADLAYSTDAEDENLPMVTVHSAGNIVRGKTGAFVLKMRPALGSLAMYVNFKVSGTAVAGVDYVALVSPAHIGPSGYATILVK